MVAARSRSFAEVKRWLDLLAGSEPLERDGLPPEFHSMLKNRRWLQEHAARIPAEIIQGVDCPILILPGARDFQVQPERVDATFSLVGLDPNATNVDGPSDAVHGLLRKLDIDACDLVEPLRADADGAYFEYDGHWTPHGHAVVADTIRGCF